MHRLTQRLDWILAFGWLVVGLLLRLPYLYIEPRFVDEGLEVLWGLDIARGIHFPLTGYDAYYGPLYYYLIAAVLRIAGTSLWVPRLFVAILGACVTLPAYWLGRKMGGRASGFLTAALAAANPALIVWSSHYAWSNSLSPLVATLAFCVFYIGVTSGRDRWLIASGFLAALMVQTHPITIVGALGMLVWFLSVPEQRARLRKPAPYLTIAAFVIGYAPMIIATLQNPSALAAAAHSHEYAFVPTMDWHVYGARLVEFVSSISSLGADWLAVRNAPGRLPFAILGGILGFVGLIWTARRGNTFPLTLVVTAALTLPVFLNMYEGAFSRYISFLLPILFAAVAVCVTQILTQSSLPRWVGKWMPVAGGAAALIAVSVVTLQTFYVYKSSANDSNADFYRLSAVLHSHRACAGESYLESGNPEQHIHFPYASYLNIKYTLTLGQCSFRAGQPTVLEHELARKRDTGWIIIPREDAGLYRQEFHLTEKNFRADIHSPVNPFALYRVSAKTKSGG